MQFTDVCCMVSLWPFPRSELRKGKFIHGIIMDCL
jgi:hypothetical protein